jgi:hypothetical protein
MVNDDTNSCAPVSAEGIMMIPTVVPLYLLIRYLWFTAVQKKNKIKEINGSYASKRLPSDNRL